MTLTRRGAVVLGLLWVVAVGTVFVGAAADVCTTTLIEVADHPDSGSFSPRITGVTTVTCVGSDGIQETVRSFRGDVVLAVGFATGAILAAWLYVGALED